MNKITKDELLDAVTRFYLGSHDFNGIPAGNLAQEVRSDWNALKPIVRELIEEEWLCTKKGSGVLSTFKKTGDFNGR